MKKIFLVIIILSIFQFAHAGERLAVLPINGSGIDSSTQQTVSMLLASELRKLKTYDVIPEGDIQTIMADRSCTEPVCAADIGRQANASKVVYGSLNKLGEKIIFQYNLVDVNSGATVLSDELTATRVEDLDQVTKRVAASIDKQTPVNKTVEVGLVTEQESKVDRTRKATASVGIGFGYLYPQKGYDGEDRDFVFDFKSVYEMRHVAVDALLGIRKGFALNVGVLYLPSLKDFSPYAGVGLGFHAVSHEHPYSSYPYNQPEKHGDGFEILAKAGVLAFRTYDFRVFANAEYAFTLNDYNDGAIVVTIGVMRSGKRVFGIF